MNIRKQVENLKRIHMPKDQFVVVSSGALAVRGIREANDIDVIVQPDLWAELTKKYIVKLNGNGIEVIALDNEIEILNPSQSIFGNSSVIKIVDIFKYSDEFDDIKYINLDHLKSIKSALGRDKDLRDITLIEEYMNQQPKIIFDYSLEDEISRVKYTIKKYAWYVENGYKPTFPQTLIEKIEKSEHIDDSEIESSIKAEYVEGEYTDIKDKIAEGWEIIEDNFFSQLKTLGRSLPNEYYINLTKYGTSGSYGFPNDIQINFKKRSPNDIPFVIAHEIVHLTIEDLISKYGIEHWTKERLVNLTINCFFPDKKSLQRDPQHSEQITQIFENNFPNLEKIITEISEIK